MFILMLELRILEIPARKGAFVCTANLRAHQTTVSFSDQSLCTYYTESSAQCSGATKKVPPLAYTDVQAGPNPLIGRIFFMKILFLSIQYIQKSIHNYVFYIDV